MFVEDGQRCACILRGENVEVFPEDLFEGGARGSLVIDDQNGRFKVGCARDETRSHMVTCIAIPTAGQGIARIHAFARIARIALLMKCISHATRQAYSARPACQSSRTTRDEERRKAEFTIGAETFMDNAG